MGDVYLVEDTKLDRKVALKVLPPIVANDPQRRIRFAREAKTLAALNHPNIVTVHSVEEIDGVHVITMELVRGKSLEELLPKQGLALRRFFEIAIPLSEALVAAHQQGITHRDIKPANVMLTDDGRVKVLDFGLAQSQDRGIASDLPTQSLTQEHHVVGTPAYMSPEQAEGRTIDQRSDLFSLGVMFYEMLTGERPFKGDTPGSTLAAVAKDTARPVNELRPSLPRELVRVVQRCLAKAPIERYQSAIDLRHDLVDAKNDLDSGVLVSREPRQRRRPTWLAATAASGLALGLVMAAWFLWTSARESSDIPRLLNPAQVTSTLDVEGHPTWSPDNLRIAYETQTGGYVITSHSSQIWVAQIGSGEPVNLTSDYAGNNRMPSWSPDGRDIAFLSDRGGTWGLYVVAAIGGTPRRVLALPDAEFNSWSAPQWSAGSTTLSVSVRQADQNVVLSVSLQSMQTTHVVLPPHQGNFIWDLSVSPDGRRFAYLEGGGGATEVTRLWVVPSAGGDGVPLTDGRTQVWTPTWSRDGTKIFYVSNRAGTMDLWQQRVSPDGAPAGDPVPITQGLGLRSAAFSGDGKRLAYTRGGRFGNVWRVPILGNRAATWGDATQITAEQAYIEFFDVSPDGTQLVLSSDRRGNQDLWLLPANGGIMSPITTDPAPDWNPRFSPDGKEIAFYSYRSGNRDIWVIPTSGGPARQITSHPAQDWMPKWSGDGREIAFHSRRDGNAIWVVSASGGEPRRIASSGPSFAWSRDGQWFVINRDNELFRMTRDGSQTIRLGPGYTPRFSADGRSVMYSIITGPPENHGHWARSIADNKPVRLTELKGRHGRLGDVFAADARYLYFTWHEDAGDIWVMDVVGDGGR